MKIFKRLVILSGLAFVLFTIGCSSNPASSNGDLGSIKISVKANTAGSSSAKIGSVQSGLVTITSAHIAIEKIRFDSTIDDTLNFRFRSPFVRDLALDTNLNVIETVQVPFGTYKESRITIADLDPEDGDVFNQFPELQDNSIVIKGYLNDDPLQAFTFATDFTEQQKRQFSPPLVLDASSPSTSVVLSIDMSAWFVDQNGNLLDPRSLNNASDIEDNIKASIEIFEDQDDDGVKD